MEKEEPVFELEFSLCRESLRRVFLLPIPSLLCKFRFPGMNHLYLFLIKKSATTLGGQKSKSQSQGTVDERANHTESTQFLVHSISGIHSTHFREKTPF